MTESTNIETISKPEFMTSYLHRLQRGHILISLSIPGNSHSYNTIIMDVDSDKHQMLLDVIHTENGHNQLIKRREFSITAFDKGIKISFKGHIKALVNEDGKPAYLIDYPETLHYHQQRSAYRAPVSIIEHVKITIRTDDNKKIQGLITDVSLGGLCVQFERQKALPFEKGMLLPVCQFAIPDIPNFECALEVRNVRQDKNSRVMHIGARFMKLNSQEERQIQRFVMQLERNLIKRGQR